MAFIGQYKIRGLLGRGGMSKVYLVEIPEIKKFVALKLLSPSDTLRELLPEATIRGMFVEEAVKLAGIRHPHIVDIYDYGHARDTVYYTMTYHGFNLGQLIGETYRAEAPTRVVSVTRAVDIIRQTLDGLDCLHYHGITHGDIKPFNLLVSENDRVRICDFGLSRLRGESAPTVPSNLRMGTPYYTAPEQEAAPERMDSRSDLYAVGVLLHRLLYGRLPTDDADPPDTARSDLERRWKPFFRQALAPKPADRYQSAADMNRHLTNLLNDWEASHGSSCRLVEPDDTFDPVGREHRPSPMRSTCIKMRGGRPARSTFDLDALWRPNRYVANRFDASPEGAVTDHSTRLVWQRAGSAYPLSWTESQGYIDALNRDRCQGRNDWRLPTIAELITLLTPPPAGNDHCLDVIFDPRQKWLWSCDRRTFTAAWFVSLDLGFVGAQEMVGKLFVRAVCRSG